MSGIITRSNFPKFLGLSETLKAYFGLTYDNYDPVVAWFFDQETSTKSQETYQEAYGFGLFTKTGEGINIPFDSAGQGYSTSVVNLKFSSGFEVTEEMVDDDLYNLIKKLAVDLATAARETQEMYGADQLINSSTYTTSDGQAYLSTAHVVARGGTFANRPTTPASFSRTSVEADFIAIQKMVDPAGRKKKILPIKMVVPPDLDFAAARLFGSDKEPETGNNAINPLARGNKLPGGYKVWHYLTSTGQYFYRTNVPGLVRQIRRGIRTRSNEVIRNEVMEFVASYREAHGLYDPRALYSNGMSA
jgi:hypothetical protein